jgi:hypothetical protein
MVAGPMGLGKTTMLGLMVRNQLGLGNGQLLGLPIPPCDGKILYLAMDRPAQIARAMARQFKAADRKTLAERLVFWKGPPPGDVARRPTLLLELAEAAGASVIYLDSVKDAAVGLSDDVVGAAYNRARQTLLQSGRELAESYHTVKRGANGGAPTTAADVYGSAWIANGTGSIAMLTGEPGDPIVGFLHIRQPAAEVGPFELAHDQHTGRLTIHHVTDLVELAALSGADGITAKTAAATLFQTEQPSRGQLEKARRRLEKLADQGFLKRVDGARGGSDKTPSAWFPTGQTVTL